MNFTSVMKSTFFALFLLSSSFSFADDSLKGLEIAIKADKTSDGFVDSQSTMEMQLTNRKGNVVTRNMK
jgi:hypothetical protein